MDHPQDPACLPVSVVVPCRNEARTIGDLLDALDGQDHPIHEIIIVDDQSTDASRERIASRSGRLRVQVVDGQGRGPAAAMNAGVRAAAGDVIVRLDGHCRPHAGYVRRAVSALRRDDVGVVGGLWEIETAAPTTVGRAIAAVTSHPIGSGGVAYRDATRAPGEVLHVDTVPFGCFRRGVWASVGGYDESLASNEDYDFNHRVRCAGYAVLLDTAMRSTYTPRPTLGALSRQYFRYGFWKTQMLRKSPGAVRLRQVLPALLLPWLATTLILALTITGGLTVGAALLYPAVVVAAVLAIAKHRRDGRLIAAALAVIVVQHTAWSAGFWHGLMWPPSVSGQA